MTQLLIGQQAPDFKTEDQDGTERALADYAGQWLLIYFYPKDMTSGCTVEAQLLRDSYSQFKEFNAEIIGVSKDTCARHKKFIEKESLPFNLLADTEFDMLKAYDVWKEKSMFGKKYMGIMRTSFLIDPNGKIAKVYDKIKPVEHAEEVLVDLQHMQGEHVSA